MPHLSADVPTVPFATWQLLGWLGWPLAYLMGVPPADCELVGRLLGLKTAANEFVAYSELSLAIREGRVSERAVVIASYALCGFANLGSCGLMVGALSSMAPKSRAALAAEVLRAMLAGTLACFATACIASAVYDEDAEHGAGPANVDFSSEACGLIAAAGAAANATTNLTSR